MTLRLAHRGDWRRAPENSLEALVAAMTVPGCDGVEFDVRLAGDDVPVLLHDETLARVQLRHHHVGDLLATELAEVGIPELARVLRVLPEHATLLIELKGDDHWDPTADVLRAARGEAPSHAFIASFEARTVAAMGDRLPGWARWLNAMDMAPTTLAAAVELGCRGVSVAHSTITPAAMQHARSAGLEVAAWTVRRRASFARLARLGVAAVCVEGPALDG